METFLAVGIFLFAFIFIVFEIFDKSLIALFASLLMVIFGILTPEQAIESIHFETILLLLSMMLLVHIAAKSGVFEWLNIKIASITRGNSLLLFLLFCLITFTFSAVLDNVTTIILIVPITIELMKGMGKNPKPFIFAEIIFSNIGGDLTLVGDPTNIIIGGQTGLSFLDFIVNLWKPILACTILAIIVFLSVNWKDLKPNLSNMVDLFMANLLTRKLQHKFLKKTLNKAFTTKVITILVLTVIGFLVQHAIGLPNYVIALTAAIFLAMVSSKQVSIHESFESVEWTTLFFFAGLFVMVGGVEHTGLLEDFSNWLVHSTDDLMILALLILWTSGFVSMILDNIPYVTVMVPVIMGIQSQLVGYDTTMLWWSLSLGACLGGTGTLIGASANVISVDIAKKNGVRISFLEYMRFSLPLTIGFLSICSVYIILRLS